MGFSNVYDDSKRAESYSKLEFPGTYYLAYRDLPQIIAQNVSGKKAVDFGCGTGRSTRFLRKLGFETIGVDISEAMIAKAKEIDPEGDYRLVHEDDFSQFKHQAYDLVLFAFTLDNIPTMDKKAHLFRQMKGALKKDGRMIALVSSPEIYTHEWTSFSTKDFPANRSAKNGDKVKIVMTDVEDKRPVEDILWSDEYYRETFKKAELALVHMYKPLAKKTEAYEWINETRIAPWVIYVLKSGN
jgi:ubiquinone/menaquinone biosynthesis C-methylase UbiE